MIKFWQFRFIGETDTREIPYGKLEEFLETLPLPSKWPFKKDIEDCDRNGYKIVEIQPCIPSGAQQQAPAGDPLRLWKNTRMLAEIESLTCSKCDEDQKDRCNQGHHCLRSHQLLAEHDAAIAEQARKERYAEGAAAEWGRVFSVIRPPVLYFALCMEAKLRKHDSDRGERGWYGYDHKEDLEYLYRRLEDEMKELESQINSCNETIFNNPPFTEAEDVGNFAMMIRTSRFSDETLRSMIQRKIESLRSQPEQCPAGGCEDEVNCPDACRVKIPKKQQEGERE